METKKVRIQSLIDWATFNGAVTSQNLKFETTESGTRGVAIDEIKEDELLKVPESITINPNLAESFFGSEIFGVETNRNPLTQLLLAKLKYDSNNATLVNIDGVQVNATEYFAPYISTLPSGKQINSPLFWDAHERSLIAATDAHGAIDSELNQILELWHQTVSKLPENLTSKVDVKTDLEFYQPFKDDKKEQFAGYLNQVEGTSWTSFPAFLWTHAIFASRAFPYVLQLECGSPKRVNDVNEGVLIPLFDLLNHKDKAGVKWTFKSHEYTFVTLSPIKKGDEIWNSYGPKTNKDLLLNYGFVSTENKEDNAMLALRLPVDAISAAIDFGVTNFRGNEISFLFKGDDTFDKNLVTLFSYLVKTKSESGLTLRNALLGLGQVQSIIETRVNTIKGIRTPDGVTIATNVVTVSKAYRTIQRKFLQKGLDELLKLERMLIKKYKPDSFRALFKKDQQFANALLLTFGIDSYDKLASSDDDLTHVLTLYLMRVANGPKGVAIPEWLPFTIKNISRSVIVTEQDVKENLPVYRALFPTLAQKVPEVFGKGDWSIKRFIVASTVREEIVYVRSSGDAYFVNDLRVEI